MQLEKSNQIKDKKSSQKNSKFASCKKIDQDTIESQNPPKYQ